MSRSALASQLVHTSLSASKYVGKVFFVPWDP